MPRTAREASHSGVYHAILRGVNKQQIFECSEDYQRFLQVLRTQTLQEEDAQGQKQLPHCAIYAYCQMGNHVHLLLKEIGESIADIMKRIASSYVFYYNHKYDRCGHLFQERFRSQPCDNLQYFVTLLRYIHQNPLKPGLVQDIAEYPWSSWHEFLGQASDPFCATNVVLQRIPLEDLRQLIQTPLTEEEEDGLLDHEPIRKKPTYTDEEIWQLITQESGTTNPTQFQALPRPQQKHILYIIHEYGIGPRTLSRLTGVPYAIVQRATSKANEQRNNSNMVCEDIAPYGINPEEQCTEEEYLTYCDEDAFLQYPEY